MGKYPNDLLSAPDGLVKYALNVILYLDPSVARELCPSAGEHLRVGRTEPGDLKRKQEVKKIHRIQ